MPAPPRPTPWRRRLLLVPSALALPLGLLFAAGARSPLVATLATNLGLLSLLLGLVWLVRNQWLLVGVSVVSGLGAIASVRFGFAGQRAEVRERMALYRQSVPWVLTADENFCAGVPPQDEDGNEQACDVGPRLPRRFRGLGEVIWVRQSRPGTQIAYLLRKNANLLVVYSPGAKPEPTGDFRRLAPDWYADF